MVFKSKASLERFTGYEITESVAIEGYYIDKSRVRNIISGGPSDENEKMFYDAYITALKYYNRADKGKIKEITLKLINDINKSVGYEGALRDINVRVGDYLPPAHENLYGLVKKYIEYSNSPDADVAVQHILFESIHPYRDGNGRTGRIINNIMLLSRGKFPVVIEERRRREYYAALAGIRNLKPESVDPGPMIMVWSGNTVPF